MDTKAGNASNHWEGGGRAKSETLPFQQPWWRGLSNDDVLPTSASTDFTTTSSLNDSCAFTRLHINGIKDTEASFGQEIQPSLSLQSYSDNAREQPLKQVSSSMPHHIGKTTNSQMGPVGHSIVLTSHPFQDPTNGGFMAYAQQVNPQQQEMHQIRMPLPLAMEEEPVYVNAKQYHGILRRRQIRARAELEKKAIKNKKPYLHESRHKHALRRERGAGGRFLNTKKLSEQKDNNSEEFNYGRQSCGPNLYECSSSNESGNAWWNDQESRGKMDLGKPKLERHSDGGNEVHGLFSTYKSLSDEKRRGMGLCQ